jgi:FkbM family methyltransferase
MREQVNYLLSRQPRIYESILRLRGDANFEKILFLNVVGNGDVVFDVGANRGYYTVLFSHLVGKRGQVHAFEPVPTTFSRLSSGLAARKKFDNVYLKRAAVGDVAVRRAAVYLPGEDDGQASLKKHAAGSWETAGTIKNFECEIIRLDDYISSKRLERLDFIKCDIEGAELLALRGAAKCLTKFAPMLYLEVCPDWTKSFGYNPAEISQYLSGFGYSEFYLVKNGLRRLENPAVELTAEKLVGSANLLCGHYGLHSHRISGLARKQR